AESQHRPLDAVARLEDLEAGGAQRPSENGPRHLAVVDDEHPPRAHDGGSGFFCQLRTSVRASSRGGSARSADPRSKATLGMPKTTELGSSCAMVRPPARLSARSPSTPSDPMPVKITPADSRGQVSAQERKSSSADGRWPRRAGGPASRRSRPPAS